MNAKFKVGDKVIVKQRTQSKYSYRLVFTDIMAQMAGKICTIKSVTEYTSDLDPAPIPDDGCIYTLKEDCMLNGWVSSELELCPNSMTISDLKPGMILKLRNNKKLVVLKAPELIFLGVTGCELPKMYNSDMTYLESKNWDIMKVYEGCENYWINGLSSYLNNPGDLIWERTEYTELSMQEIADKFGIPIKQLKIKKQ